MLSAPHLLEFSGELQRGEWDTLNISDLKKKLEQIYTIQGLSTTHRDLQASLIRELHRLIELKQLEKRYSDLEVTGKQSEQKADTRHQQVKSGLSNICNDLNPLKSIERDSTSVRKMTQWILGLTAATFLVVLIDQACKLFSPVGHLQKQQTSAPQTEGVSLPPNPSLPLTQPLQRSGMPAEPVRTPVLQLRTTNTAKPPSQTNTQAVPPKGP